MYNNLLPCYISGEFLIVFLFIRLHIYTNILPFVEIRVFTIHAGLHFFLTFYNYKLCFYGLLNILKHAVLKKINWMAAPDLSILFVLRIWASSNFFFCHLSTMNNINPVYVLCTIILLYVL